MDKEIDRQIAEKVMGWEPDDPEYNIWYFCNGKSIIRIDDWQPSTNIAHAFEVVEKMREKGFCFQVCDYQFNLKKWNAVFVSYNGNGIDFNGDADTLTMAICLAALEAKGRENG